MLFSALGLVVGISLTGKHIQCSGGLMNYLPSKLGKGWLEACWKGPALSKVEKMQKCVGLGQCARAGNEESKENPG